jgi:hypothetical protein
LISAPVYFKNLHLPSLLPNNNVISPQSADTPTPDEFCQKFSRVRDPQAHAATRADVQQYVEPGVDDLGGHVRTPLYQNVRYCAIFMTIPFCERLKPEQRHH